MAPVTITLFEHQPRTYAEIGLYPADPTLHERVLAQLERLNEISGQEILHLGRKAMQAGALVGVVRVGDVTIEILPKLDWQEPGQPASPRAFYSATRNLLAMLSYAYDLQINEQEIAGLNAQTGSWIELLTRLFAAGLHRQILAGLSQQYVAREEKLSVLRGRWDVQRQARQPGQNVPAFDVIYDDLSPDIPLNQVFRFAVEQLLTVSRDPSNLALLGDLLEWFRPVTALSRVPAELFDNIHFNRLNERFQPALALARMFLTGSAINVTAGDIPTYSFVFDMNALFERFVARFLARHRQAVLPADWQDAAILPQSEGLGLYLARSSGKQVARLRPDLLFTRKGQPVPLLVADTKYKRLDASQRKLGVAQEDLYQMLAYAVRLKCPRGLLLYPQTPPAGPLRAQFEIASAGMILTVATINLHVPLQPPDALIRELKNIFQLQPGN